MIQREWAVLSETVGFPHPVGSLGESTLELPCSAGSEERFAVFGRQCSGDSARATVLGRQCSVRGPWVLMLILEQQLAQCGGGHRGEVGLLLKNAPKSK